MITHVAERISVLAALEVSKRRRVDRVKEKPTSGENDGNILNRNHGRIK